MWIRGTENWILASSCTRGMEEWERNLWEKSSRMALGLSTGLMLSKLRVLCSLRSTNDRLMSPAPRKEALSSPPPPTHPCPPSPHSPPHSWQWERDTISHTALNTRPEMWPSTSSPASPTTHPSPHSSPPPLLPPSWLLPAVVGTRVECTLTLCGLDPTTVLCRDSSPLLCPPPAWLRMRGERPSSRRVLPSPPPLAMATTVMMALLMAATWWRRLEEAEAREVFMASENSRGDCRTGGGRRESQLSVCLPVCLSICPTVCLFICLSVRLSVHPSICLSVCLPSLPPSYPLTPHTPRLGCWPALHRTEMTWQSPSEWNRRAASEWSQFGPQWP